MNALVSLIVVLLLVAAAWAGAAVESLQWVFGIVVPGLAIVIFLAGVATANDIDSPSWVEAVVGRGSVSFFPRFDIRAFFFGAVMGMSSVPRA